MARMLYHIPVLGWMIRSAAEGPVAEKLFFALNLVMLWIMAILVFGYPALILPALVFVPLMFVILILITKG